MAPVRGHRTQGEGVDSSPASRALPQLTRSTARQIVTEQVCALRKLKKIRSGKRARRRNVRICLESGLAITDATAPAAMFAAIRRTYAIPNFFDTCAGV
jgi:hypothetical protein